MAARGLNGGVYAADPEVQAVAAVAVAEELQEEEVIKGSNAEGKISCSRRITVTFPSEDDDTDLYLEIFSELLRVAKVRFGDCLLLACYGSHFLHFDFGYIKGEAKALKNEVKEWVLEYLDGEAHPDDIVVSSQKLQTYSVFLGPSLRDPVDEVDAKMKKTAISTGETSTSVGKGQTTVFSLPLGLNGVDIGHQVELRLRDLLVFTSRPHPPPTIVPETAKWYKTNFLQHVTFHELLPELREKGLTASTQRRYSPEVSCHFGTFFPAVFFNASVYVRQGNPGPLTTTAYPITSPEKRRVSILVPLTEAITKTDSLFFVQERSPGKKKKLHIDLVIVPQSTLLHSWCCKNLFFLDWFANPFFRCTDKGWETKAHDFGFIDVAIAKDFRWNDSWTTSDITLYSEGILHYNTQSLFETATSLSSFND